MLSKFRSGLADQEQTLICVCVCVSVCLCLCVRARAHIRRVGRESIVAFGLFMGSKRAEPELVFLLQTWQSVQSAAQPFSHFKIEVLTKDSP